MKKKEEADFDTTGLFDVARSLSITAAEEKKRSQKISINSEPQIKTEETSESAKPEK